MNNSYSVFISATSDDLLEFRTAAREAALSVGIRPVMMEYFPASGNPPLDECLARVSACDLTIVIVARRYGWVPDDQVDGGYKSITWLECQRTTEDGNELLAFLLDKNAPWPVERTEQYRLVDALNRGQLTEDLPAVVSRNVESLNKFRDWLESGRTRSSFTTPDDIRAKITLSLFEWREKQRGSGRSINIEDLQELNGFPLDGYRIFQGLRLNDYSNGVDGYILILLDQRINGLNADLRNDGYAQLISLSITNSSESFRPDAQVRQALLLVIDNGNRILYSEQLGRESARLDRVFLYPDKSKPTFIVTRDYSAGMGSYNGPISYFLEVSASGIRYIFPHGLMTSLKSAWVLEYNHAGVDVVSKRCRPDFSRNSGDPMEFQIIYERFFHRDGIWQTEVRIESGFWEMERPLEKRDYSGIFTR